MVEALLESTLAELGCSPEDFVAHLERRLKRKDDNDSVHKLVYKVRTHAAPSDQQQAHTHTLTGMALLHQLLTFGDFMSFSEMMLKRNSDLQEAELARLTNVSGDAAMAAALAAEQEAAVAAVAAVSASGAGGGAGVHLHSKDDDAGTRGRASSDHYAAQQSMIYGDDGAAVAGGGGGSGGGIQGGSLDASAWPTHASEGYTYQSQVGSSSASIGDHDWAGSGAIDASELEQEAALVEMQRELEQKEWSVQLAIAQGLVASAEQVL